MWTIIVRDAQGRELGRADLQQGTLTIGREKDRGLVLPSGSVSRKHARFELRGDTLMFVDEGSANGSIINGQRVGPPVEVNERSVIEITPFRLSILKVEAEDEERTVMLRRPAAPPRPAAPAPAADEPRFIIPETPKAPPPPRPAAAPGGDLDSAAAELDRQIQSIRSFREQSETTATQMVNVDQDWAKLVAAMLAVRKKLAGNPKLMAFDISRDGREIAVKIKDPRQRLGYRYFLLSRTHPDGKNTGVDSVWLREVGREDMDFRSPKDAQTELLQRVAATLA